MPVIFGMFRDLFPFISANMGTVFGMYMTIVCNYEVFAKYFFLIVRFLSSVA